VLELFIKGGPVMYPIALCAIIATVIIVERFMFFHTIAREDTRLLPQLRTLMGGQNYGEAQSLCEKSEAPLGRLVLSGIGYRTQPIEDVKEAVTNAANREVPRIERYISALGTIANISTLLGLLGTVSGNIRAFGVLAASGAMGNPALLAGAIAEALITTAAGLIVAIPAAIFYNYFVARSNKIIIELESGVGDLVLLFHASPKEKDRAL
jgi:biopolymer transport protein ExbB